jgi:hypothetical protein
MRRVVLITLSLLSAAMQCFPQAVVNGSIRGEVFTTAEDHTRSIVARDPGRTSGARGERNRV